MRLVSLLISFGLLVCGVLLSGCSQKPVAKEPPKEYVLHGEVKALDPKAQLATVDHEKIDGWMEAMTMEYPIKDPQDFSKLKVGSRIDAKVIVQGTDYWLVDISEYPAAEAPAKDAPAKSPRPSTSK
jgi:Cu/Ag efflux protein CusF